MVNWMGVHSNARCDKTRQSSIFFPNKKERKLCKKKRRRGKGWWGGGGRCLTFFKGIISSLSALLKIIILGENGRIIHYQCTTFYLKAISERMIVLTTDEQTKCPVHM